MHEQRFAKRKIAKLSPQRAASRQALTAEITDAKDYELKFEAQTQNCRHGLRSRRTSDESSSSESRIEFAQSIVESATLAEWIDRYRENVNFDYWRTRCRIEQLHETVTARRHIFNATQLKEKVELDAARKEYEQAWDLWAKLIEANPELVESLTADDLLEYVTDYVKLLSDLDEKLPEDFKLRPLLEKHGQFPAARYAAESESSAAPPRMYSLQSVKHQRTQLTRRMPNTGCQGLQADCG